MKKFLTILLTIAMLASFAACENNAAPAAKKQLYITNNNLEIEEVEYSKTEDGYVDKSYFQISGLKDEKIQDAINQEVEDTFMYLNSWEEIPSYRGIKVKLKKFEGLEPDSTWANASVHLNTGNVLSAELNASMQYSNEPRDGYYEYLTVSNTKTLNYDLNTGKKLLITDIFKDGVDGIEYINEKINDMLVNTNSDEEEYSYSDGWNTFKLVGSFDGIKEDQKFYVLNGGNTLVLILDQDTPWAFVDSMPIMFNIDITDVSALATKYVKENIYTDEMKNYVFPYSTSDEGIVVDSSNADYEYKGIFNCFYEENISHYSDNTEAQIKPVLDFVNECKKAADEFVETVARPHQGEDGLYCSVTTICTPQRIGSYTVYRCNCYMDANIYGDFDYIELGNQHFSKVFNYKDGVDEALELKDLFIPGYDLNSLGENIENYSFQIGNEAIYFENDYDFITWEFKDIGCDNLTLFD